MKKITAIGILGIVVGCTPPSPSDSIEKDNTTQCIRFLAFGDWGRMGSPEQVNNASAMAEYASNHPLDFIVSTGDNFYDNGVSSIHDEHWVASFEDVYNQPSLQVPWYVVLGNHDYRGNVDAQLAYRSPNNDRWNLPGRHYLKNFYSNGIKVALLVLDTSPTEDTYYEEEKYKNVWSQDTASQKKWARAVLDTLKADYIFVAGHHPLYSGGKRQGETFSQLHHWEPLFRKYHVSAYLCGHEHDLQYHEADFGSAGTLVHIVTGAGSEIRPTGYIREETYQSSNVKSRFATAKNGFTIIECGLKSARIELFANSELVFTDSIPSFNYEAN